MTRTVASLQVGNRLHELAAFVALLRSRVASAHQVATFAEEVGSAVHLIQQTEFERLRGVLLPWHALLGSVSDEDITNASEDVEKWITDGIDVRSVLDPAYPDNLRSIF